MNTCCFTGRFSKDPDVRYIQGGNSTCVARFSLAVQRRFKRDGDPDVDFLNFVAFGKQGEFVEKYFKKGMKADVVSHCQTGSYTNKESIKIYTTDFIIDNIEFGESKSANNNINTTKDEDKGYIDIPDEIDEDLPFN